VADGSQISRHSPLGEKLRGAGYFLWATQTSTFGTSNISSVAYGDGLWVAGGVGGPLRVAGVDKSIVVLPLISVNHGLNGWITEKYICQSSPPPSNQKTSFVCGAETGRVYLRPQPNSASMNSKQTLANETLVQIHEYRNGYVLVETLNGMTGWVTEQYICP
jgi:hypothetical protein